VAPLAIVQRRNLITIVRGENITKNVNGTQFIKEQLFTLNVKIEGSQEHKSQLHDIVQNIEMKWREYLGKCVDSSPLVVVNLCTAQSVRGSFLTFISCAPSRLLLLNMSSILQITNAF
jgi:hypothetical protein